jgi:hypothetical protein
MRRDRLFPWRAIVVLIAAIFGLATSATAIGQCVSGNLQCGPNGCRPPWAAARPQVDPRSGQAQVGHPATCRIDNALAGGTRYLGTGTLVDRDDRHGLVVTCQHIFRGGTGTVSVTFPDGQTVPARVVHADGVWDLAALLIDRPVASPVSVAQAQPQRGATVWSCGYGPDGRYRCNRGQVTGYVRTANSGSAETLELTGSARQGDSGGPVFDERGELVAVLWGTDGRTVGGTYCGRVDHFLTECGRYLLPYRAREDNRIDNIQQQIQADRAANPAPVPFAAPSADLGVLAGRLQKAEQDISSLFAREAAADAKLQRIAEDLIAAKDVKTQVGNVEKEAKDAAAKADKAHDRLGVLDTGVSEKIEQHFAKRFPELAAKLESIGAPSWVAPSLVGVAALAAIAVVIAFLRKEGARAASGEPTRFQRLAQRTPWTSDDAIADKSAAVLAQMHNTLGQLHGSLTNLPAAVGAHVAAALPQMAAAAAQAAKTQNT